MIGKMLCVLFLTASTVAQAQSTAAAPPASAAKKELVTKMLALQQPGLELAARGLIERPASQMLQEAGRFVQTQVPAEKREAVGKAIEADVKKYVDETLPLVRDKAMKLAPSTLGAALEEKFSEDELKQLLAFFESALNKKFQQVTPEMQNNFMQKLVADSRPVVEPKLQALQQQVRTTLNAAAGAPGPGPAAAASPAPAAPKAPARPASK